MRVWMQVFQAELFSCLGGFHPGSRNFEIKKEALGLTEATRACVDVFKRMPHGT